MKLLKITTSYPSYLKTFYSKNQLHISKSYAELKSIFEYDAMGWADFWSNALKVFDYEVMEISINNDLLQRKWARENGFQNAMTMTLNEIVIEQVGCFTPEILWFDHYDEELLKKILISSSSISLVLGWAAGTGVPVKSNIWKNMNVILSCTPEIVDLLNQNGQYAIQLHHGFEPRINSRLQEREKCIEISFIGQIVREGQFHSRREKLLYELCKKFPIQIYSPETETSIRSGLRNILKYSKNKLVRRLENLELPGRRTNGFSILEGIPPITESSLLPLHKRMPSHFKPAVFGVEMYQIMKDSKIAVNIHADDSPTHASNMRLFEATGVGTCLITDWKENINELFEPDKEIVTYQSANECVEKIDWLLSHPREREEIAKAGQARCLRDHTYARRAVRLDQIIKSSMYSTK